MNYLFLLLAFLIGVTNATQSGVNSGLRHSLQNPLLASIISFATGFISLSIAYAVIDKSPFPVLATFRQASWWQYTGGLLGAFYVLTVVVIVRQIGSANMMCLIVAGQMVATILIDHFGLMNFPIHAISFWRIVGMLMIVGGVYVVLKN